MHKLQFLTQHTSTYTEYFLGSNYGESPCQYFQLHSSPAEESFCSVFSIYWLILANQNAKEKKNAIAAVYLDSL